MSDDKQVASLLSFCLPLCIGLFAGLIIFNPSEGFIVWWESIDWREQGVANVGAWVAGIATSLAALATAAAAHSSARAADAATKSANQWRVQASYNKYIDTGVKARIKLRWLEAHLQHMCNQRFSIFYGQSSCSSVKLESPYNDAEAFLSCLKENFIYGNPDENKRFKKYKETFKYQSDCIKKIYPKALDEVEETFELSKNHVGISDKEKVVILEAINEFITQIGNMGAMYNAIIEQDKDERTKKIHINSCLNVIGAKQHYYYSTLSNIHLISGYIDNLVLDSNQDAWAKNQSDHIKEEQRILASITKVDNDFIDKLSQSIARKFEN
ncbi:hypothetical protein BTO10_01065 [Vibrio chagasii]|uniref:DUF4760 domain-containing protein n=1 Tax=Vibrio chagasii TaxID=170679 RepID=A0A2S7VP84_9VIBR|nr:hypothetical protein [Vibrio chagasii]PQJ63440.1 hypothetical protein BTO10_01065 [Vibrio chagasii]